MPGLNFNICILVFKLHGVLVVAAGIDIAYTGWYARRMTLFCFLWIPVFYFFWRSIKGGSTSGWAWALIAGSIVAVFQFFGDPFIDPGGFGFSRWSSGFVDIVVLPVVVPLVVYLLFFCLKFIAGAVDFTGFALLWLIPIAAARSLTWSIIQRDPILLVLVPVLWTAIAVGVPFFIKLMQIKCRPGMIVLSGFGILAVLFAAATTYWAFFSQRVTLGIIFLAAATAPMLVTVVMSFIKTGDGG